MNDIEIQYLTKKALQDSLLQEQYWNNEKQVPFSINKAQWLCSNPRINENDHCAVIALENNCVVGFIYLLPDLLYAQGNTEKKASWIIYWWVTPKYENNVLATYIFAEALRLTNNQVLVKSYAEHIGNFYNRMPFKTISAKFRYTLFFSLDASILLSRFKFLKYFKGLVKLADGLSRNLLAYINNKKAKKQTKTLQYEYLNALDETTWRFIEPLCLNDLVVKTKDYINWQISPMQFSKTPLGKTPYTALENGTSPNIYIHNVKILLDQTVIGFLSYIVNYKELNIKYFLVKDENHYSTCAGVVIEHLIKHQSTFMFTDDSKLAEHINKTYKTIFIHKVTKKAIKHKDLVLNREQLDIKNQDGHFY